MTVNLVCENFSFAHWFECQLDGEYTCTQITPEKILMGEHKAFVHPFYVVDCQCLCLTQELLKRLLTVSKEKCFIVLITQVKDLRLDPYFSSFLGKSIIIHYMFSSFKPVLDFLRDKTSAFLNSISSDFQNKLFSLPDKEKLPHPETDVFYKMEKPETEACSRGGGLVFCSESMSEVLNSGSGINSSLDFVNEKFVVLDFREKLEKYAASGFDIFLLGECGSGKSWTARKIYEMTGRRGKFVGENLASVNGNLLESRLFGCIDGAYTGAKFQKGLFEEACSGTLFLDEIGELSMELQPKLLDVIENRMFRRQGSIKHQFFRGRIIFATNKNLEKCIKNETFRKDLYDRISMLVLDVPPLRQHPSDIIPLAKSFAADYGKNLTDSFCQKLLCYDYPGNIRELKNIVIRSCLLCES